MLVGLCSFFPDGQRHRAEAQWLSCVGLFSAESGRESCLSNTTEHDGNTKADARVKQNRAESNDDRRESNVCGQMKPFSLPLSLSLSLLRPLDRLTTFIEGIFRSLFRCGVSLSYATAPGKTTRIENHNVDARLFLSVNIYRLDILFRYFFFRGNELSNDIVGIPNGS